MTERTVRHTTICTTGGIVIGGGDRGAVIDNRYALPGHIGLEEVAAR